VHLANKHDRWGGKALLEGIDPVYWPRMRKMFVDLGCRGLEKEASALRYRTGGGGPPLCGGAGVWVREGEEVPEIPREGGFVPLHKRWVVERTLAWLGRCRRLSKDFKERPEVSEAWVYLGMIRLLVRRLARAA